MPMTETTKDFKEVKEKFCGPCNTDLGKKVLAEAFCEDCEDYLCLSCLRPHSRYNRDHTVTSVAATIDFDAEHCRLHKNRPLHFYCKSCGVLSCVDCRKEKHNNCEHVFHLTEIIDSMEEDESGMETYAEAAKAATTTVRQNIEECMSSGARWKWTIQDEVKASRNKINMTFNQLEVEIDSIALPDKQELENYLQAAIDLEQYIAAHQSECETDRNGFKFRFFIFQKTVQEQLKNLLERTRSLAQVKRVLEYSRKLRGLKPKVETDLICLENFKTKDQPKKNTGTRFTENHRYCIGLFKNIIYELFCLTVFIVFILKQRRNTDSENYLLSLGAGMVLSLMCKVLLPLKCTRVALSYCLITLSYFLEFIIFVLNFIPIVMSICLITVLRVLNKIPIDRSCLTMIFAFGYAVVQKTGLLFSLLAFALHCIPFIFIEPKQNVAIWWILCITFTYFFIILFSSFGIRYNQVRMKNRTYFSWKRSKTPFSNLYRNLLSFIQEH